MDEKTALIYYFIMAKISVIAPFYNEEGSVKELHGRLVEDLDGFF